MKYFAVLLLDLSLQAPTVGLAADRTITWHPWQEWAEFRVRTGDRYLGADRWEHSLGFELYRPSPKKIQISMISLAGELVLDVVIVPGETLRNSQGHQLKHDCAQRALELDCPGDWAKKPLFASGANRTGELFFH